MEFTDPTMICFQRKGLLIRITKSCRRLFHNNSLGDNKIACIGFIKRPQLDIFRKMSEAIIDICN